MDDDREAQVAVLRRRAMATGAGLIVIIVASGGTCLLLVDSPKSADLTRLALVSVAAGALGAALGAFSEILGRLEYSFWSRPPDLPAPTRKPPRRTASDREREEWERDQEREREREQMTRDELRASPLLLLFPLIGGTLGLVLFAGVVGGFLVANPSSSGGYSFPGILFLSFLAGFFARNFIARLGKAAEALFGPDPYGQATDQYRKKATSQDG